MGNAIWSERFAGEIAQSLGYARSGHVAEGRDDSSNREVERILSEITEAFRYLPLNKVQLTRNLALFLRGQQLSESPEQNSSGWLRERLQEILEFALFLKGRHGHAQPADESDEWTDEDRRDATLASMQRLDEPFVSTLRWHCKQM